MAGGGVSFVSASLGFCLGLTGDANAVLQTTDGGRQWRACD